MLIAVVVLTPAYLYFLVKWLPNTPLGRRLFLRQTRAGRGEGTPEARDLAKLVGSAAVAETDLRPSGTIRVDGRRVVALAEGDMIEKGEQVKVIRSAGSNVIVRRAGG
jgi:membrane-bound serine protease (ClpP class)